jgi:hypothetical protein
MTKHPTRRSIVVLAALLFSSALAASSLAQSVSFVAGRDFRAGSFPHSIAAGDFNGDWILDLAVANRDSSSVSVLFGNGDGTFQGPATLPVDGHPMAVAVGDFDGNGVADLAVANYTSNNVSVLLGNDDGTFQTTRSFVSGIRPVYVAVTDFNGDAVADLAVANLGNVRCSFGPCTYDSGSVSVLLGNGDGTMQPAQHFEGGSVPRVVAVGDFNRDGLPDVAVIDHVASTTISVLLGNGDGTLQAARRFDVGRGPSSVAVGDVDNDGSPDLVVSNGSSADLSVLLGSGDGTFHAAQHIETGGSPLFVAMGDFNRDAIADVAVTDANVGSASVLLGNGDGTFLMSGSFAAGPPGSSVAVGDFNVDGTPDLAIGHTTSLNGLAYVSVVLGYGDGTFQSAPAFGVGVEPYSVAVADFNGDAVFDVAVANRLSNDVSVLQGRGDGTFEAPRHFAVGSFPLSVAAGDFNGDGTPDLTTANMHPGNVSVLLGNGDGTFQAARDFIAGAEPSSVTVGEFNSDGVPDLAVANRGGWGDGSISVLLGNGDGSFQSPRNFAAAARPWSVSAGDVNADGSLDLVVANAGSGNISVLLGNGDGTFQASRNSDAGSTPTSVAIGHFNTDGMPDLAVANSGPNSVCVLLGNGDGTFQVAVPFGWGGAGTTPTSQSVAVGDFNGDGHGDLAVANEDYNHVSVLMSNGDGTFQEHVAFGAGGGSSAVAVADFNNDGRPDLAAANTDSNSLSVLMNNTAFRMHNELIVSREGNGSGAVTSWSTPTSSNEIDCGTTCSAIYDSGTTVTLTAHADMGSTFAGWAGCDAVSGNACTVTMSEAKSVVATFVLQRFVLAVSKSAHGRGTVTSTSNPPSATQINCGATCSVGYNWNTVLTLTATPAFGNLFLGWSGCDASSGTTCRVTMSSARRVTATFVGLPLLMP